MTKTKVTKNDDHNYNTNTSNDDDYNDSTVNRSNVNSNNIKMSIYFYHLTVDLMEIVFMV